MKQERIRFGATEKFAYECWCLVFVLTAVTYTLRGSWAHHNYCLKWYVKRAHSQHITKDTVWRNGNAIHRYQPTFEAPVNLPAPLPLLHRRVTKACSSFTISCQAKMNNPSIKSSPSLVSHPAAAFRPIEREETDTYQVTCKKLRTRTNCLTKPILVTQGRCRPRSERVRYEQSKLPKIYTPEEWLL